MHITTLCQYYHLQLTEERVQTQRVEVTCPKSENQVTVKLKLEPLSHFKNDNHSTILTQCGIFSNMNVYCSRPGAAEEQLHQGGSEKIS